MRSTIYELYLFTCRVTSFADIRIVDGKVYPTYRKACLKGGLLSNNAEWKRALWDGFESFYQPLTESFAKVAAHCELSDLKQIFEGFRDTFITDRWSRF